VLISRIVPMQSKDAVGRQPEVTEVTSGSEPSHAGHTNRMKSLDGLRGVAALIVVFGHTAIASSKSFAATDLPSTHAAHVGSLNWFVTRTPLVIFLAGSEMVLIFFVLSGYVLALPAVIRGSSWLDISYYPRRLARLYIPAWAALIFGGCLHELHRRRVPDASWWLNSHAGGLSIVDGLRNATLLFQSDAAAFTSVIWSLRDEVIFSLLLPLILLVVLWARKSAILSALLAAFCFIAMIVAADRGADLRYMPLFVIGSLMAFNIHRLPKRLPKVAFPVACVFCACLITTSYMTSNRGSGTATGLPYLCNTLGSCLAVWIAIVSPQARHLLTRRPVLWLGSRSYSLYLIHEPIVVGIAFLLGGHESVILLFSIAVPLSLIAADLFWRLIESPSIRFARALGRHAARLRPPETCQPGRQSI
jgi:peptidoglycan/LPS O-acetylase OafA/YrhL